MATERTNMRQRFRDSGIQEREREKEGMRMKEVNQICYNVCCVIFAIVCWNVQIHAVNAHFVGASKRRRRKNEKKKNHLWQNWHRYRWSFFHFFLDDCDYLVCCRKYNGYKQICELHGIVEFQKEKLEKMVLNDFEKMWNWDNDEHSDRFFSIPFFCEKKIFLHIVKDINVQ